MFAASAFKKGLFLDKTTGQLRPTYLSRSLPSPVTVPVDPLYFVLPFSLNGRQSFEQYEQQGLFDASTYFKFRGRMPPSPFNEAIRTAALIYLCGQVRLGKMQCRRCQRRRVTTATPGEAIPVCASAGSYFHGVCANCFAAGATLHEMLNRCSVSRMSNYDEYDQLTRAAGTPGMTGRSPFVGDDIHDRGFVESILWKKGLPPGQNSNSYMAPTNKASKTVKP